VEKIARVFHSFAEADQADADYYRSLTPEQRLEILFDLIKAQQPDEPEQRLERVCRIITAKPFECRALGAAAGLPCKARHNPLPFGKETIP
jgi:hypothetical protein